VAPRVVWTGAEDLALTGIRSPDRPTRSESLYQLRYPGPRDGSTFLFNAPRYPKERWFWKVPRLSTFVFWEGQHVNEIDYGASGGMILTVEYVSTRRKAVPMPPCPLQILHGLTYDPVGALFRSSVVWVQFLPHREHRLRYENQSLSL
jgi:hypothetical protein